MEYPDGYPESDTDDVVEGVESKSGRESEVCPGVRLRLILEGAGSCGRRTSG